jgi:tripartite-type tricarboxylate transporter receptor subunit TctC
MDHNRSEAKRAARERFRGVWAAPGLPDVPTVAESGVPGFEYVGWNGILVPAATPAEMRARAACEADQGGRDTALSVDIRSPA